MEKVEEWMFGRLLDEGERDYFMDLTMYGMHRLQKEPQHLQEERQRIAGLMEKSAVDNYKSFIDAARCMEISKDTISDILNSIPDTPNDYEQLSERFLKESKRIRDQQKSLDALQNHQDQIMDIIDIPRLMDACVRQSLYEEALDLKAHSEQLLLRNQELSILQSIVGQVEQVSHKMKDSLLKELEMEKLSLTRLLAVISYLRQLRVFSEQQLRREFLSRREQCVTKFKAELDHGYKSVTRLFDFSRTFLFEVITQYNAIFVDESEDPSNALQLWVSQRVEDLLTRLNETLPTLSEGKLVSNLLKQTMSCAQSLGRIGVDFRSLLPSLFESAVLRLFEEHISIAQSQLVKALRNPKWSLSDVELEKLGISADENDELASLLRFPPLAIFANGFIIAFNELSQCAPLSLKVSICDLVKQSLDKGAESILFANRSMPSSTPDESSSFDPVEEIEPEPSESARNLATTYIQVLVPFVVSCANSQFEDNNFLSSKTLACRNILSELSSLPGDRTLPRNPFQEPAD